MRVARVKLANVRPIKKAELRFRPGFNLIVGVNGVGKTAVLDALAVCLSDVVRHANALRGRTTRRFDIGAIRLGSNAMDITCDFESDKENVRYVYTLHKPRDTPETAEFVGDIPPLATGDESGGRPLAVLFSTNRAVPSEKAPAKGATTGGTAAAFWSALSSRELRLGELAAWIQVQEALKQERSASGRTLHAMGKAITRFLPSFRNLRVGGEGESGGLLLIDRDDCTTLPVRFLSDGERGVLAIMLDLTRRLAQANPNMKDPAAEAEAIVLIDEIELHLHPKWQRAIVGNLTKTFPKCQFIATTHSPQVIGEVERDRVQIITNDQVHPPPRSFGLDSSSVLEEIMKVDSRTEKVKTLISKIARMIGNGHYDNARELLAKLIRQLGEDDPEVTYYLTLLDFMTDDE